MNSLFAATGALSHFNSTSVPTPLFQSRKMPIRPNAVSRSDRPACTLTLSLRSQSIAACSSPPVACSASLHFIMGRLVLSRSDFTAAAVIFTMLKFLA